MPLAVNYTVDFEHANQHLFTISIQIPKHNNKQLTLSLPAWLPGSYMIRDFAKHIVDLSASNDATITPIDKQTWLLATEGNACTLNYQVFAFDSSVRTAYLDNQRAFFNGSSLFLCIDELQAQPHRVNLIQPQFSHQWQVATGLPRAKNTERYQFGFYEADNYNHLIDCPFEIANFDVVEFLVADVPHFLVLTGKHFADTARIVNDLSLLCQHHISLFEKHTCGKPPFDEYWFLTNILPNQFGGLEHKNSTALLCSNFDFPNIHKPSELSEGYQTFLSLASHEYFHAWNVCRIKPAEFVPYQLNAETYTEQLWTFEGITSYYDDLSLSRTGLITTEQYLTVLGKTIGRVNRGKGQNKQSLLESSFYTWTKFYQQGPDAVNNIVSYYTKGSLIALWLDLTIRRESNHKKSLDDVMRLLWQNYYDDPKKYQGIGPNDVISIVNSLLNQDLHTKFQQLLQSKSTVPLADLLADFGVELSSVASSVANLLIPQTGNEHSAYIGLGFKESKLGIEVTQVLEGSPAENSGLSPTDIIIAIDKMVINKTNYTAIIDNLSLNQAYTVDYIRNNQLYTAELTAIEAPCELTQLSIVDKNKVKLWQQY